MAGTREQPGQWGLAAWPACFQPLRAEGLGPARQWHRPAEHLQPPELQTKVERVPAQAGGTDRVPRADKGSLPETRHASATLPTQLGGLLSLLQPGELCPLQCPVPGRPRAGWTGSNQHPCTGKGSCPQADHHSHHPSCHTGNKHSYYLTAGGGKGASGSHPAG